MEVAIAVVVMLTLTSDDESNIMVTLRVVFKRWWRLYANSSGCESEAKRRIMVVRVIIRRLFMLQNYCALNGYLHFAYVESCRVLTSAS